MRAASILDYREAARRRLPAFLFEYIDGGSYDERTLSANIVDLRAIALRQRVLTGVGEVDLSTDILGEKWALPVGLAPVGLAGMNSRRGEVAAARAAEAANVPFCLSTVSACPIAEVRAGVEKPFWFQLYMIRDRRFMIDLLATARAAGCRVLVFTVDMPVPGTRYRDYRSGLAGASGWRGSLRRALQGACKPAWAWDVGVRGRPHSLGNVTPVLGADSGLEDFFAWMRNNFDADVTWRDVEWVREQWGGPIVLKGILDVEDARAAKRAGVDGIVVSNHGGRQLDGVRSTASALPKIADAVGGELTVLADGGVRSGLDVLKLLALGADGVLIGRAWAMALAADGQRGVAHVLRLLEAELRVAMTLTGAKTVHDIDLSMLDL